MNWFYKLQWDASFFGDNNDPGVPSWGGLKSVLMQVHMNKIQQNIYYMLLSHAMY